MVLEIKARRARNDIFDCPSLRALICVACALSLWLTVYGCHATDLAWKAQFATAVSWTAYGVKDDSGATDNTAALNSIPGGKAIIADCPHGGFVQFSGEWDWPSNLTVWQKPGCFLKSTITTLRRYPISFPGSYTAKSPITNVQYYGLNFSFVRPTSGVRVMLTWIDHLKLEYFTIDGSGGFAYIRGSDQEIAYGVMKNTVTGPGNPGIRHIGNMPKVATSPGMHANVWIHDNNFQTGDAPYQACQPLTNPATFMYDVSSDNILYEDDYAVATDALILVNEPLTPPAATNYTCNDVIFRRVSGRGLWYGLIFSGNDNTVLSNVLVDGGVFDGAGYTNRQPSFGIGYAPNGGAQDNGTHVSNIVVQNITMKNVWYRHMTVAGPISGLVIQNNDFEEIRNTESGLPVISIQGANGMTFSNNIVKGPFGVAVGDGSSTTSPRIVGNTISGIKGGFKALELKNVSGASVKENTVSR